MITIVLTAVAKLESTFLMPILANIAVAAAKIADKIAYPNHDILNSIQNIFTCL